MKDSLPGGVVEVAGLKCNEVTQLDQLQLGVLCRVFRQHILTVQLSDAGQRRQDEAIEGVPDTLLRIAPGYLDLLRASGAVEGELEGMTPNGRVTKRVEASLGGRYNHYTPAALFLRSLHQLILRR